MKQVNAISGAALVLLAAVGAANGQTSLNEVDINKEGAVSDFLSIGPPGLGYTPSVPGVDLTGFSSDTGLGSIKYSISGAGSHLFLSFLDIESDFSNGPADDLASVSGSAAAGQLWEVSDYSDVTAYNNFAAGTPANAITIVGTDPVDVALTLGYSFSLAAGDTAAIEIVSTLTEPSSGFYLIKQMNNNSGDANYLYSTLTVHTAAGGPVPDGGATLPALALALASLAGFKLRFCRT